MMQRVRGCAGAMIGLGSVLWLTPIVSAQEAAAPDKAKIETGETVYNTYCAVCHGDNLVSTGQFPNLRRLTANDREKFDTTMRNGRNQMPPWKDVFSLEQRKAVAAYVKSDSFSP